jgi:hypothetical protein
VTTLLRPDPQSLARNGRRCRGCVVEEGARPDL